MTKQIGWIEEGTEGTDPLSAGSALITFGIDGEFDRPHPQGDQEIAAILHEDSKAPVDLVAGMRSVKIKHQFLYQHGWEWYYLLGKKAHTSGTGVTNLDTVTLGTLAGNISLASHPIKSRTVYSRIDSDVISATGCKTKSFAIHCETPDPGQKPKPIWCDLELWGWKTATAAATVTAAPTYPTGLINVKAKGVEMVKVKTLEGVALANLRDITIGGINMLDYHGGLGSLDPRGIKQLEGTKIFIEGLATLDFTANDALASARANFTSGFTAGTTHTFVFTIGFDSTPTDYHTITLENVFIHSLKPTVYMKKTEAYAFMGEVMADGTNEPISVGLHDRVEYQSA